MNKDKLFGDLTFMKHLIKFINSLIQLLVFFTLVNEVRASFDVFLEYYELEKTNALQLHQRLQNTTSVSFSFDKNSPRYLPSRSPSNSSFQEDDTPFLFLINSALTNKTNLTKLALYSLELNDFKVWILCQIIMQQDLQSLNIRNFKGLTGEYLTNLLESCKNNKNLSSLSLGYNNIKAEGAKHISQSGGFPNLTTLYISGNSIGAEGVKHISQSKVFFNLTTLRLSGNNIGVEGAKHISQSKGFSNLTTLYISGNKVGAEGAKHISQSRSFPNLTTLEIEYNDIRIEGAKHISQSGGFPNLTTLQVSGNSIGVEGAKYISKSINFPKLTKLQIGYNNIGTEGIKALRESKTLAKVSIFT